MGPPFRGAWVHIFDYIAQGSWNGSKCSYVFSPSAPAVNSPNAFTRVRSTVKVTGLLGIKMQATGGVVRL